MPARPVALQLAAHRHFFDAQVFAELGGSVTVAVFSGGRMAAVVKQQHDVFARQREGLWSLGEWRAANGYFGVCQKPRCGAINSASNSG